MRLTLVFLACLLMLAAGCSHGFERTEYEHNYPSGRLSASIDGKQVFSNGPDISAIESYDDIGKDRFYCYILPERTYECNFYIKVMLSDEASERFSEDVGSLERDDESPDWDDILKGRLDIYLDNESYEEQYLGTDLQGVKIRTVQVTGHGDGLTKKDAMSDAEKNMKELYDILADKKE